ncbi:MAG: hypothetical protein V1787_00120 [Candidatus Micrarchaeota archaeon]
MRFPDMEVVARVGLPLALACAVVLSMYTHSMVFREWTMPTYGNTFIHVASIRHAVTYGSYPMEDYSYGGGIPNLYVPFYRIFVADTVLLTGLSIDFVSRAAVMLFSVLFPLAFFALGRRMFGDWAGVFAAFFCSLPGELLIYTVRPLPQALGMVLLPVAFLALYSERRRAAMFLAFAVAMVHQEAAVFYAGVTLGYFLLVMAFFAVSFILSDPRSGRTSGVVSGFFEDKRGVRLAFVCFLVATLTYLLWHYWVMHTFDIFELAQFKNHEGGFITVESFLTKTGLVVASLSILGLLFVLQGMVREFLKSVTEKGDVRSFVGQAVVMLVAATVLFFFFNGYSFHYSSDVAPLKDFHKALSPLIPVAFQTAGLSVIFGILTALFVSNSAERTRISEIGAYPTLFAFAVFFTGLFATQNHLVGIRVFMDRFLVYLHEPLVLLAALGAMSLLAFAGYVSRKS